MYQSIAAWLVDRREKLWPEVVPIPWWENHEWMFADGALRHKTNGFFKIVGVEYRRDGQVSRWPMIEQPDIGLLGFIVCEGANGPRWLLQAKSEPGSVHFVQAAPSVQATESNYLRLHGGKATAFLDFFHDKQTPPLVDIRNSEQGSCFLSKFNRNAIRLVEAEFECPEANWRWFDCVELRWALSQDFLVNTDARSVIVCSPWRLLASDHQPFASDRGHNTMWAGRRHIPTDFVSSLRASYGGGSADIGPHLAALRKAERNKDSSLGRKSLSDLEGWRIDTDSIRCVDDCADCDVVNYRVFAPGREVEHWAQPLLQGRKEEDCRLVMQVKEGRLKLFLSYRAEPGFRGRVEFGPSLQSGIPAVAWLSEMSLAKDHPAFLTVRQSEEGGRFWRTIVNYSLQYIHEDVETRDGEDGLWVDLAELQTLCLAPRTLTNEARTAISILLSFA